MAERACHVVASATQVGLTQALGRMRLTSLAKLLSGELPASAFSAEIADELLVHTGGLQKLGGSAPVVVTQDTDILLDRVGLSILCRLFASGQLSPAELAYTADALQLSERVESRTRQ